MLMIKRCTECGMKHTSGYEGDCQDCNGVLEPVPADAKEKAKKKHKFGVNSSRDQRTVFWNRETNVVIGWTTLSLSGIISRDAPWLEEHKDEKIVFDSKVEMGRFRELVILLEAGEIKDLIIHPKYLLLPSFTNRHGKKRRGIYYEADFQYVEDDVKVVEDVKGGRATQTYAFMMKQKMFEYRYADTYDLHVVER